MRESVMHRLLAFSQKHSIAVIAMTAALTLVFGYFALHVRFNSNIESLVPQNNQSNKLIEKYSHGTLKGDYFAVAVTPHGALTVPALTAFHAAIEKIDKLPGVSPALDPFNYLTFKKVGGQRITVVPLSEGDPVPQTQEQLSAFEHNLKADPFAKNLIVSHDGKSLAALFLLGTIPNDSAFLHDLNAILASIKPYFATYYTGTVSFSQSTREYLIQDLPKLFVLAALVILFIYYVGFRSKRAVVLPLLVVSLGTLWTVGFMSMAGFELTIISIVTPPLVLTLGSSYSIHILNQYYREVRENPRAKTEMINSVDHVNATILLAAATTVFGFMSLLPASMYQLREFGIATSFGILACAGLSLFFFPAMLSRLKVPRQVRADNVVEGFLARLLAWLAARVLRVRVVILAVVVLLVAAFFVALPHIRYQTNYVGYFPQNTPAVRDLSFIDQKFGGFQQMYLTVTAPRGERGYFLRPEALQQVASFEAKLKKDPLVVYAVSFVSYLEYLNQVVTGKYSVPQQPGLTLLLSRYLNAMASQSGGEIYKTFLSPDLSQLTVSFRLFDAKNDQLLAESDLRQALQRIQRYADESFASSLDPQIWGGSLRFLDLSKVIRTDQGRSTVISIALIFLLTAISFRSIRQGLFALVPLVTAIMTNYVLMVIANIPLDMTTVMFSSVAIGVGVDNSIHFLLQYRKQQASGLEPAAAIQRTLEIAGRPIVLTTASVVGGLLVLLFASFRPIIYFGLLVSTALTTAMIATLIVLPVVLDLDSRLRGWRGRAAREGARLSP